MMLTKENCSSKINLIMNRDDIVETKKFPVARVPTETAVSGIF